MINCENISKSYTNSDGLENQILDDLQLNILAGQSLAVMGPSGSGKTTLLKIIGLLENFDGNLSVDNTDIKNMDDEQCAKFRNVKIGFVFQNHQLLPQCTLLENILLPTLITASKPEDNLERAQSYLKKLNIEHRANHFPSQVSGGECQRTALIRALINKPKVILADEPTGALDYENANNLTSILIELTDEENISLLMATHAEHIASQCTSKKILKNKKLIDA
jgi:lipoprotein-releasing system ATP-binding protein